MLADVEKIRDMVAGLRQRMVALGRPEFINLILRADKVILELNAAIKDIKKIPEREEMGLAFLVPLAWTAGAAAFAAGSKWISDAYITTKQVEREHNNTQAYAKLAEQYGPNKAIEMIKAQNARYSWIDKMTLFLGISVTGFMLLRMFK